MRLTSDLILRSPPILNCLGLRSLILRDLAIPQIENLALTHNAVDLIDLSNNMISELSTGFPPLSRLKMLYLGGNRISRIGAGLADSLPNLNTLILTANRIASMGDLNLDELEKLTQLEVLCIRDNQVESVSGLRGMLLRAVPSLKVINFEKVKDTERVAANADSENATRKRKLAQNQSRSKRRKKDVAMNSQGIAKGLGNGEKVKGARSGKVAPLTPEQSRAVRQFIIDAEFVEDVNAIRKAIREGTAVEFLMSKRQSAGD